MGEVVVRVNSYGPDRPWSMVYTDPISGKRVVRSTGVPNDGTAKSEKAAERAAGEWEAELNSGRYKPPSKITWPEFRERFEAERFPVLRPSSTPSFTAAFNHVERVLSPDLLRKLTTPAVGELRRKLRAEGMRETTLGAHLRHLKAALR